MNAEPAMAAAADVIRTFGHGGTRGRAATPYLSPRSVTHREQKRRMIRR